MISIKIDHRNHYNDAGWDIIHRHTDNLSVCINRDVRGGRGRKKEKAEGGGEGEEGEEILFLFIVFL